MTKKAKPNLYGHEARIEKILKRLRNVRTRAEEIVRRERFLPESVTSVEQYDNGLARIDHAFRDDFRSARDYRQAMKVLEQAARTILDTHHLRVALPSVPVKMVAPRASTQISDFQLSQALYRWDTCFKEQMESASQYSSWRPERWLGFAIYSAITRGGLLDPTMVVALAQTLCSSERPLAATSDLAWIDLTASVTSGGYNHANEKGPCHLRRWFVDPISLSLISSFYASIPNIHKFGTTTLDEVFKFVRRSVFGADDADPQITTLRHLTQAARWFVQTQGAKISPALIEMAAHGNEHYAACPKSWGTVFEQPRPISAATLRLDFTGAGSIRNNVTDDEDADLELGKLEQALKRTMRSDPGQNTKITTEQIQRNLSEILTFPYLPSSVALLVEWYIDLCVQKRKPGTLKKYHGLLTHQWLSKMGLQALSAMTEEDFLVAYGEILRTRVGVPHEARLASLVRRVHEFGRMSQHYDLPHLPGLDDAGHGSTENRIRIRAKVIGPQHIWAAISGLDHLPISSRETEQLRLMACLAWRTGMRIGEVVKLQNQDVGKEWLYVQTNSYGYNKTSAGSRRLPIRHLLSKAEYQALRAYITRPDRQTGAGAPFFAVGHKQPWDASYVSSIFAGLLRDTTGDPDVVFHHLRHTAVTYLHAVIEQDWGDAERLSGLPQEKLCQIREAIVGAAHKTRDIYWALAVMIGHASPAETMKSYMHMVDLVLFRKLYDAPLALSKTALSGLTGVRSDHIDVDDKGGIHRRLIRKNRTLCSKIYSDGQLKMDDLPEFEPTTRSIDFQMAEKILQRLETGETVEKVADHFGIEPNRVFCIRRNAQHLMAIKTRKGLPRFCPIERIERFEANGRGTPLTPPRPRAHSKYRLHDTLVQGFRKPMKGAKGSDLQDAVVELKNWCQLVLPASSSSRPELRFSVPQHLSVVITGAQHILPAYRWRVVLQAHKCAKSKVGRQWRACVPKGCALEFAKPTDGPQDPRNKNGSAHLFLTADPSAERETKDSKFSPYRLDTKALVYVAYILMVILATEEDLVRLAHRRIRDQ